MFVYGVLYERMGSVKFQAEIPNDLWIKAESLINDGDNQEEFINGEGSYHYSVFNAIFTGDEITDTYVWSEECSFGYGKTLEESKINFVDMED